jgi:hypothetical protein
MMPQGGLAFMDAVDPGARQIGGNLDRADGQPAPCREPAQRWNRRFAMDVHAAARHQRFAGYIGDASCLLRGLILARRDLRLRPRAQSSADHLSAGTRRRQALHDCIGLDRASQGSAIGCK